MPCCLDRSPNPAIGALVSSAVNRTSILHLGHRYPYGYSEPITVRSVSTSLSQLCQVITVNRWETLCLMISDNHVYSLAALQILPCVLECSLHRILDFVQPDRGADPELPVTLPRGAGTSCMLSSIARFRSSSSSSCNSLCFPLRRSSSSARLCLLT